MSRQFLFVIMALALAACATDGPPIADLAFSHATIIDVEDGSTLPDQTILIHGNRIVGVGPTADSEIPEGARVIDAAGRFVIPGLWDAHVHSAAGTDWHFPLLLAHGVTSVRNMHTTVDTALSLTNAIKQDIASGRLLGPRFLANGPIIDGAPAAWPGAVVARNEAEGRAAVDSLAAGGADFIKVYDNLLPETYQGIMDQARSLGIPVDGHVPGLVSPHAAAAAGQRTIEHTSGITTGCSTVADSMRAEFRALLERMPSMEGMEREIAMFSQIRTTMDHRDEELCAETARAYREAGVVVVPTLVTGSADAAALVLDARRMNLLPARVRGWWEGMAARGPHPVQEIMSRGEPTGASNAKLLHQEGVMVLAGTDIGNPFLIPGLSLHEELSLLVSEAEMSPLDALRAATLHPAQAFGLSDSLGTVATGKLADLVLLEENPLEKIEATRAIAAIVVNGRYIDRGALDGLLAEAAAVE